MGSGITRFISHRGNLDGKQPDRENSPAYIDQAIMTGFQVEVDVRLIWEDFYLGHDFPQYKIDWTWIEDRHHKLLLHLKDTHSLARILTKHRHWHYFCHQNDSFTFTSQGYLWLHDLCLPTTPNMILPLISESLLLSHKGRDVYAVCSDYCAEP